MENDPKGQWRVMERRRHCSKEYYSVAHYCVQLEPDPTGDPEEQGSTCLTGEVDGAVCFH